MSKRYLGSLLIGILVGIGFGVYLGWEQFPVKYTNSSIAALDTRYQEEYTLMVAEAYQVDRDPVAARERLVALGKENIPDYVQDMTERYISQGKDLRTIQTMVALAEAMGRLTSIMEIYLQTPTPAPN
ncbi:MAG TPA: hypothetical protein VHP83_17095 [Aggregatilineaceae bacterium]|nr:hypothetical protein [Aggregatilineaceae bacterium]